MSLISFNSRDLSTINNPLLTVLSTVTRGADKPGAKMLEFFNWFEMPIYSIKVGKRTFSGRFRPNVLIGDKSEFLAWYEKYRGSIIDYFNNARAPNLPQEIVNKIYTNTENVHYFSKKEIQHFKITFKDQLLYTQDSILSEWKDIEKEPGKNIRFSAFNQSKFPQSSEFTKVPSGEYMYVLNNENELIIAPSKDGEIHHSSLSRGEAVLSAGMVWIEDGKIIKINNASGHYRPKICQLMNILEYCDSNGLSPNTFTIEFLTILEKKPGMTKAERRIHLNIKPGEGMQWMHKQKSQFANLLPDLKQHNLFKYPYAILAKMAEPKSQFTALNHKIADRAPLSA